VDPGIGGMHRRKSEARFSASKFFSEKYPRLSASGSTHPVQGWPITGRQHIGQTKSRKSADRAFFPALGDE
jgi:hypothetical protein